MHKVELVYVEVLNETEQLLFFTTIFNKEIYGSPVILNTALTIKNQDIEIQKTVEKLKKMTRKDAKESEDL